MNKDAYLSDCRQYRYALGREWDATLPSVTFIGLNPSTADENLDDPTIRRCIAFAKSWGFGTLHMVNLFAFRATQPKDMMAAPDPVGEFNDWTIQRLANESKVTVAAWGAGGIYKERDRAVRALKLPSLHYLRLTKDGHPGHPLYLPKTLVPIPWV